MSKPFDNLGETDTSRDPHCHNCDKRLRREWHVSKRTWDTTEVDENGGHPYQLRHEEAVEPVLGATFVYSWSSREGTVRAIRKTRSGSGSWKERYPYEVWGGEFNCRGSLPYAFCTINCGFDFGSSCAHAGYVRKKEAT